MEPGAPTGGTLTEPFRRGFAGRATSDRMAGMFPDLSESLRRAAYLASVPAILRPRLTPEGARATIARRLRARSTSLPRLLERLFRHAGPRHPYRRLLRHAGCEPGDLAALCARQGIETALAGLAHAGVYLTVDEMKGRATVERGSLSFRIEPGELVNPFAGGSLVVRSSGSRGGGSLVPLGRSFLRCGAIDLLAALAARGGLDWTHALWAIPGGAALLVELMYGAFGRPPAVWFSQVDPASREIDPRYRWSAAATRWAAALAGVRLPPPGACPLDRPLALLAWIDGVRARGGTPQLVTFPTSALALARYAAGVEASLDGLWLWTGGEPVTEVRRRELEAAGIRVVPQYGSIETGFISDGCLAAAAPDEVHLFEDTHAVVQAGDAAPGVLPADGLLVTTLDASAPLLLLNVSLGDRADLSHRVCGCPLEALGWRTHLASIRSFEKLTLAGMTFLDADVERILERDLPARFGGGAGDYQLVEREEASGRPRLELRVSPRLGEIDPRAVETTFYEALIAPSPTARLAGTLWREGAVVEVCRAEPVTGTSGKILHVVSRP